MNIALPISARWTKELDKEIHRRHCIVLYGNIHDQFLWRGSYHTLNQFLNTYFHEHLGFQLVVHYDPIDGWNFPQSDMQNIFQQLTRQHSVTQTTPSFPPASSSAVQTTPSFAPPPNSTNPDAPPPRRSPAAILQNHHASLIRISPENAFGDIRVAVSQTATPIAAIVDLADMLTADPDRYAADERNALVLLRKSTLEAAIIRDGDLTGYRNTVIILASDLKRVPSWFYLNNPHVAIVHIPHPNKEERRHFVLQFGIQGFYGGDKLAQSADLNSAAEEFADLTEGFRTLDLEAIRHASWRDRLSLSAKTAQRLINTYKFGKRDNPFEQISPEKIARARNDLSRTVIGQPQAIEAVTTMLTSAKVGISLSDISGRNTKPKGIFFFVGPTGVGKTELAKATTRLIFGDEQAFCRFDMSEYKEEHAAEKLAGAPPGFVGYEEGGQLTNRVLERPYSILLFDEIEKAHPRVLDKFLQILEDGRLTDGKGQTAYFDQTIIIFTSNIGASDLSDPQTSQIIRPGIMSQVQAQGAEQFSFEAVDSHFRSEVDWYFTSRIGRAELLNRLGDNIIVFDLLRPEFVVQIGQKFLNQLAHSAQEKHQLTLIFSPSVLEVLQTQMLQGNNLLFGGRRLKTLLESLLERPLNRWIFEHYPDLSVLNGQTLTLNLDPSGTLQVRNASP